MKAIEVKDLSKSFGTVVAVHDLSFGIPLGKVTGFLGANGAGKTTTLRMILGLARPDAGSALLLGRPYVDLREPALTVGAMLGADQFHPGRTGRNHLQVMAAAAGLSQARVDEVLEIVELSRAADRTVGGYSLGMKQRLGLAAALLGEPRILVLDEPANGLDPAGIRWLRSFLNVFASRGRAVFVSSHLLGEVAEMADDVVVIDRGRLVTHAPVADLVGRTLAAVRVETSRAEVLADLLSAHGLEVERLSPHSIRVEAAREIVGGLAAEAGIPIFGLEQEERSLEDVFFELTKTTGRSA